jgi:uncharacterized protein (TIGR03067 family)
VAFWQALACDRAICLAEPFQQVKIWRLMIRVLATIAALTALWALPCFAAPPTVGDLQHMEGTWNVKYAEKGNKALTPEESKGMQLRISGRIFSIIVDGKAIDHATFSVDSAKVPKELKMESPDGKSAVLGIYKFESDELRLCWDNQPGKRPATFNGMNGSGSLVYFRLVKAAQ